MTAAPVESSPVAPPPPFLVRGERIVAAALATAVVVWALWLSWTRPPAALEVVHNEFDPPAAYHLVVDINHDSWRRMTLIPGLGEKTARSIIADRDANGFYPDVDALTRVRGVGPRSLERWREYLTAQPASPPANE